VVIVGRETKLKWALLEYLCKHIYAVRALWKKHSAIFGKHF